jgi:quercetin dioxygenase-like cupin family protein
MGPDSTLVQHRHDHEEVFVVLAGAAVSVQENREYHVLEGDAVMVPAGVLHHARATDRGAELLVAVPAGTATFAVTGEMYIPP